MRHAGDKIAAVHLRAPSVDKGVSSFIWALVFFLILWLGGRAVGVSSGTAFVLSAVAAFGIFFYIRLLSDRRPG
jgi:membrane protein DedA with SNARE-associated domain